MQKRLCGVLVAALSGMSLATGCRALEDLGSYTFTGTGGSGGTGGTQGSSSGQGGAQASSSAATTSGASSTTASSSSSTTASSSSSTTASSSSSTTASSSSSTTSSSSSSGTADPDTCPGEPVAVALGAPVTVMGNTSGATDKFTGDPMIGNCFSGAHPGPDLIYAVQPSAAGTLTVTLTTTYTDGLLHLRTSCPGSVADEVACHAQSTSGAQSVSLSVKPGTTYYVAADSYNNTSGAFTLTFKLM